MDRHFAERVVVTAFGFCVGASLAVLIAPGDIVLWVLTGIVLGLFARSFFARNLGGDLFWPHAGFHYPRHHRGNRPGTRTTRR